MSGAFYNERDPFAAQWLRNLMAAGLIPLGVVDERDIRDIRPVELAGFSQCHFFAGIGVWPLALRRAGWADDRQVWTGSCPCQPFSAAGAGAGFDDERHLWPAFFHLISQHGPAVVLGEQVASKDGLGWFDLVSADLEGAGYAVTAGDLCAAGFGGAHIRQRLYFVGLGDCQQPRLERHAGHGDGAVRRALAARPIAEAGDVGGLAYPNGRNAGAERQQRSGEHRQQPQDCGASRLADADQQGGGGRGICGPGEGVSEGAGAAVGRPAGLRADHDRYAPLLGRDPADWLFCRDGKWRPVEPSTFPLADATPGRVGRLRAYGNALDLGTATGFVEAVVAAIGDLAPALERAA